MIRKQNGHVRKDCESRLLGAFQAGQRGKWKSRIRIGKQVVYLKNKEGKTYFHSAQEAHEAYISAAIRFGVNLSF